MSNENTTAITDRTLNTEEAANFLKVHVQTLATWRCYHRPPAFTKGRKKIYYKLSELIRFADAQGYDLSEGALA